MGIGEEFENLQNDAREYVKRSIDGFKLRAVEDLSLLLGDLVCGFIVFVLLFVASLLVLVLLVMALAPYIGLLSATATAALLLVVVAVVVYMLRVRLFVDHFVRRLARMFFNDSDNGQL